MAQDWPGIEVSPSTRPSNTGTVIQLPPSPSQIREQERQDRADKRADVSTGISVRGEERQDDKARIENAQTLRKEFNALPQVREYQTVVRQYAAAQNTRPTATGDQALITAYAKMLDPGSVVREQEFNTVATGDSSIGQIIARLQKEFGVDGAGMLRPEMRNHLREEMLNLTKGYNASYNQARQEWAQIAARNGLDPVDIVGEHLGRPFYNTIKDGRERARLEQATTQEQQDGLTGVVTDESGPAPSAPSPGGDYRGSYLGQGMSGINEGIANTLGFPVDLTTTALNLIPQGINALANTNLQSISRPVGGSEWLKDNMRGWGIYGNTRDPNKEFARRALQSVGGAIAPVVGAAGGSARAIATGLGSALAGGVGGATAQRVAPGNALAEIGGELAGSVIGGGGLAALGRNAAQRQIEAKIPTVPQLKQQAGELYRQAEARGVTADPTMTQDLSQNLRGILTRDGRISPEGRISDVYPKAKEAIQLADDYAGKTMNPTQIQTVRGVMADGLNSPDGNERRIARMLTDEFDAWANPQAPELAQARDIASRYLNAEKLERARELAEVRATQFTGSGFENALTTEYRNLDRNAVKGNARYGDDLGTAIETVSRGTPVTNIARQVGRFYPSGPVSSATSLVAGAGAGGALGGPAGAGIGAIALPAIGALGRKAAERLTTRAADVAELTARNGGAIEQAPFLDPETQRAVSAMLVAQQANALARLNEKKRRQR